MASSSSFGSSDTVASSGAGSNRGYICFDHLFIYFVLFMIIGYYIHSKLLVILAFFKYIDFATHLNLY